MFHPGPPALDRCSLLVHAAPRMPPTHPHACLPVRPAARSPVHSIPRPPARPPIRLDLPGSVSKHKNHKLQFVVLKRKPPKTLKEARGGAGWASGTARWWKGGGVGWDLIGVWFLDRSTPHAPRLNTQSPKNKRKTRNNYWYWGGSGRWMVVVVDGGSGWGMVVADGGWW